MNWIEKDCPYVYEIMERGYNNSSENIQQWEITYALDNITSIEHRRKIARSCQGCMLSELPENIQRALVNSFPIVTESAQLNHRHSKTASDI